MAPRASGFARNTTAKLGRAQRGAQAPVVEDPLRPQKPLPLEDDAPPPEPIALDFKPLIAPYRKHRKLSIRVERLPPRARLSNGRNNGNASWSLDPDDLEDLSYLPPKGAGASPVLGVRIIRLDGDDGSTLALIDYSVADGARVGPRAAHKPAPEEPSARDTGEIDRLREELAAMRAALAAQEELSAQTEPQSDAAEYSSPESLDAILAEAKGGWEKEFNARLHALTVLSKTELESQRAQWQRDAEAAFANAQKAWRTEEAARLAAAEAKWRAEAQKAASAAPQTSASAPDETLAAMRQTIVKSEAAHAEAERELVRLRGTLVEAKVGIVSRDDEIAQFRQNAQRLQESLGAEKQAALAQAQRKWKEAEAARFLAAEQRLKEEFGKSLADTRTQSHTDRTQRETELTQLRAELTVVRAALHERDGKLAEAVAKLEERGALLAKAHAALEEKDGKLTQLRNNAERERAELTARVKSAIADAEKNLTGESDSRAAAAEARAGAQIERITAELTQRALAAEEALAAAQQKLRSARDNASDETRTLREEVANLRAALKDRDAAVTDARTEAEHTAARMRKKNEAALMKAEKSWRSSEGSRLAAAKAEWLADMRREQESADAPTPYDGDIIPPPEKHEGSFGKPPSDRPLTVSELIHQEMEALFDNPPPEAPHEYKPLPFKGPVSEGPEFEAQQKRRRQMRLAAYGAGALAVALLIGTLVWLALSQDWAGQIQRSVGDAPDQAQTRAQIAPPPATLAPALPQAIILRGANLRRSASASGAVLGVLPKGTNVALLGRQGNWEHVRSVTAAKPLEGWVFHTYLRDTAAPH